MTTTALHRPGSQSPLRLQGVVPPLVTPWTARGEVDTDALTALVEHQVSAGVHGVFALGSTGEVAYLTDIQRSLVVKTVVAAVTGRVPVLAGCVDLTAARVADQARLAADAGADALVATTPLYALNDSREVGDHFRAVAAAVDLPLLAYDVPVRSHGRPGGELLIELALEGVLSGVKDSSGDDVGFRRLVRANRAAGSPLSLLTGHELVCDGMLLAGADGMVPGLGNVDPAGYVRLWDAARTQDWSTAVVEQERLADLFEIVFAAPTLSPDARGVGAFKAAMVELGILPRATMAPGVSPLSQEHLQGVRSVVGAWRDAHSVVAR